MAKRLTPPKRGPSPTRKVEKVLRKQLIGQDRAIREIVRALERAFSGLKNPEHPVATLAFFGPTGTGKTFAAEALANCFAKKVVWRCIRHHECRFELAEEDLVRAGAHAPRLCPAHPGNLRVERVELPNLWTIDCEVMIRVFEARLDQTLSTTKGGKFRGRRLEKAVEACLPTFLWREGNHDDWVRRRGHDPLATFSRDLVSCLAKGLWNALAERGLTVPNLLGTAEDHVRFGEVQTLSSGLGITILHPRMARALTSSLRAQQMLKLAKTEVVVGANFHVAINVEQWESDLGQRVAQQVGSIVWKTDYEHGQLKTLDVGVGTLRIVSHNGKILLTETSFFGEGTEGKEYGEEGILTNFLQTLGIETQP